jgi:hypothetical protein
MGPLAPTWEHDIPKACKCLMWEHHVPNMGGPQEWECVFPMHSQQPRVDFMSLPH